MSVELLTRAHNTSVHTLTLSLYRASLTDPCRVLDQMHNLLDTIREREDDGRSLPGDETIREYWLTLQKTLGSTPRRAVEIAAGNVRMKRERTV